MHCLPISAPIALFHAACSCKSLQTFQTNLSARLQGSRIWPSGDLATSARNSRSTLRETPAERRSDVRPGGMLKSSNICDCWRSECCRTPPPPPTTLISVAPPNSVCNKRQCVILVSLLTCWPPYVTLQLQPSTSHKASPHHRRCPLCKLSHCHVATLRTISKLPSELNWVLYVVYRLRFSHSRCIYWPQYCCNVLHLYFAQGCSFTLHL